MAENLTRILARKHDFKPIFAVCPLRMRRNALISTSGFKKGAQIRIQHAQKPI